MSKANFLYEIVAVLSPKLDDKDKESTLVKIEKNLTAAGEVKRDHFGVKELVYKIKEMSKGDFYVFNVEAKKPVVLKEINLFLNREPNVIRYLVLKK